jgi:hypothetical protein
MRIRDYAVTDLPYLYEICLKTGDSGKDATSLFSDPFMIGQFYAVPYAIFDPRCVLVIEGEAAGVVRPLGYILGTTDTRAYNSWFDREWRPAAAAMYPPVPENSPASTPLTLSQRIRALFHTPFHEMPWLDEYPGHIHIDLLPVIQGGGWGGRLMQAYEERLKNLGCKGFHLGVGGRNERAVDFYRRYGMIELQAATWGVVFGKLTSS